MVEQKQKLLQKQVITPMVLGVAGQIIIQHNTEDIKHVQNFSTEQLVEFLKVQEAIVEEKVKRMQEVQYILKKTKNVIMEPGQKSSNMMPIVPLK